MMVWSGVARKKVILGCFSLLVCFGGGSIVANAEPNCTAVVNGCSGDFFCSAMRYYACQKGFSFQGEPQPPYIPEQNFCNATVRAIEKRIQPFFPHAAGSSDICDPDGDIASWSFGKVNARNSELLGNALAKHIIPTSDWPTCERLRELCRDAAKHSGMEGRKDEVGGACFDLCSRAEHDEAWEQSNKDVMLSIVLNEGEGKGSRQTLNNVVNNGTWYHSKLVQNACEGVPKDMVNQYIKQAFIDGGKCVQEVVEDECLDDI